MNEKSVRHLPKRKPQQDVTESPSMKAAMECAVTLKNEGKGTIASDVQGSYTGQDSDGGTPVQDADDL